jgi:pyruvate formate lyase activating enzyme
MAVDAISVDSTASRGRVFNIQRCSVHDGPGVRTTVFLKGCPLSCTWCHNPEGIEKMPILMIRQDRCLGCRACEEVCPLPENGAAPAGEPWNHEACIRCGSCVEACPSDARQLVGREFEVVELVDNVERDRVFFDASGGGVTFSGGEPLAQAEFLIECLRECRRRGLRTAVDTCGFAPQEVVLEVAELSDLLLYDLKHMDSGRHRAETGASNGVILENLRALSETGVEIWVRVPVIPGFNDDRGNIERTAVFLGQLPKRYRVWVLPYHGIGEAKRLRMHEAERPASVSPPDTEALAAVAEVFAIHHLEVSVGVAP